MNRTTQQKRKPIYRLFSSILAVSLCFTALIFSPHAVESTYVYFDPFLDFGGPGGDGVLANIGLNNHMLLLPAISRLAPNIGFLYNESPAAGLNFSRNEVLMLRAGMMFPDGGWIDDIGNIVRADEEPYGAKLHENDDFHCRTDDGITHGNFALRLPRHRGFHGYHSIGTSPSRNNYISAFALITMIANEGGVIPSVSYNHVGLTEVAFNNITSRFMVSNGEAQGMHCGRCPRTLSWTQIMEMNGLLDIYTAQNADQFRYRRFFIWGITLHALSDTFEHSAAVPHQAGLWRMLIRPGYSQAIALADRMDAAQAAVWEALHVLAGLDVDGREIGCCHVFLRITNPRANTPEVNARNRTAPHPQAGVNRFTGTFRLANLMDYFEENHKALYGTSIGLPLS